MALGLAVVIPAMAQEAWDDVTYPDRRPVPSERLFVSDAVEARIAEVAREIVNPKLRRMFINCFPNTLDTTVHFAEEDEDGDPRTFVYTGDIHAMWLRDSGAQVWPYVPFCKEDEHLRKMVEGVINCQFSLIARDPYANAFNDGPVGSEWEKDYTGAPMDPWVHERKWEVDSPCYPIRLAYQYWKTTGDVSVFGRKWLDAIVKILDTFEEQQRKDDDGPYRFLRRTDRQLDTKARDGYGHPVNPVGLIASSFRPSDDATQFEFLIPSNFFAVSSLRKASEILSTVNRNHLLALRCSSLADEVEASLRKYAVVNHPLFGPIYAYEVDGFGNVYMMDDANVPSLLSLSYLIPEMAEDPVYQNPRRFVWSDANPYFWEGDAGEGIGGPHVYTENIWPMSIMMNAVTATDDAEIKAAVEQLLRTDAGTGFMHESFDRNDATDFTRAWFAWSNTLFGELILRLVDAGKLPLLNSITVR